MSSNWLKAPGSSGLRANQQAQAASTNKQSLWNEQDRARALPFQSLFASNTSSMNPIFGGMTSRLGGTPTGAAAATPWWMNTPQNPSSRMPQTWKPDAGLLSKINPTLDVAGTGQNVYNAYAASGDQDVADQYSALKAEAEADNARNGIFTTSFAPAARNQLGIQRGQMKSRNLAGALQARLDAESQMRGEERDGAMTLADLLGRTSAQEQGAFVTGQGLDAAGRGEAKGNYLTDLSSLMDWQKLLAMMGDTSGTTAMEGNVANQYGNVADSYAQQVAANQAMWGNLLGGVGQMYAGGLFGGGSKAPAQVAKQGLPYDYYNNR